MKASKKRKLKKLTAKETKEPNITAETGNGAKDGTVPEPKSELEVSMVKDKGNVRLPKQMSPTPAIPVSLIMNLADKSVEGKPSGKTATVSDDNPLSSSLFDDDDLSPRGKE